MSAEELRNQRGSKREGGDHAVASELDLGSAGTARAGDYKFSAQTLRQICIEEGADDAARPNSSKTTWKT